MASSVALGESLVASKQYPQALGVLDAALAMSVRIGLRVQIAQSHYWLSQALTASGDTTGARQNLQDAQRELDQIKAEAGKSADTFLKRADLAPIAAAK